MTDTIALDEKYSTTRLITREKPEVVNSPEDKFETVLFLPEFSMDYELLLRAYHNFPDVIMKDIEVAAWREGGCGTGRFLEIFEEYHQNRAQNRVAPKLILDIIHLWTLAKFYIKRAIRKKI